MSCLARVINAESNSTSECGGHARIDWLGVLEKFFCEDRLSLESWVLNSGCVNLVLQNPDVSVVVVCWNESLRQYGHKHVCKGVWSWVVSGRVNVSYTCESGSAQNVLLDSAEAGCFEHSSGVFFQNASTHYFYGEPGACSVHVYDTEAITHCLALEQHLVYCNEMLSVTDAERGRSVAKICSANSAANISLAEHEACTESLRLYTCFRDMIELLHHEIDPLPEGANHSEEHITKICKLLEAVRVDEREYGRYLRFHDKAYTRNLVGYDVPLDGHKAKFTVLILCWDKGQMSPIHDHAGSSCWVKVLKGKVREVRYDIGPENEMITKRDLTIGPQQVCYINDTQGVHAMGNPDPHQVAVSMHVYAPPYVLCTIFDGCGGTKVGSMATARIPENPFAFVDAMSCSAPVEDASLSLGQFYSQVSTALQSSVESVGTLVQRLTLKEHEWSEFVHFDAHRYTRSLVSLDQDFSLMVCCWNCNQSTPIHSHGPIVKSWVKVLSGCMVLKRFQSCDGVLIEELEFDEGELIDAELFEGVHVLGNSSGQIPAVTLHLYSPPFVQMGYVDPAGIDRVIPVVHSATSAGRCCGAADPILSCDREIRRHRSFSESDHSFAVEEDTTASLSLRSEEMESVNSSNASNTGESTRSSAGTPHSPSNARLTKRSASIESSCLEDMLSFFEQELDKSIFTNLYAMIRFVARYDLVSLEKRQQVVMGLDRMNINSCEWSALISPHPTDPHVNLLCRGHDFSLALRRWDPSEKSEKDYGGKRWIKVLEGELHISQFLDGEQVMSGTVTPSSGVFVGGKLVTCELYNACEKSPCFALILSAEGDAQ